MPWRSARTSWPPIVNVSIAKKRTSGGVSAGAYDFVKDALDALGADTKFW